MAKTALSAKGDRGKRAPGRPSKFESSEDLKKAIQLYFDWVNDNPKPVAKLGRSGNVVSYTVAQYPTIEGCSAFLGVARTTFRDWGKEGHAFKEVIDWADRVIYTKKIEVGARSIDSKFRSDAQR